jgi:hypothetical protein
MTALHSTLAEAELHENKGVSTATDNTVATAVSGATAWQKVNANMIDTTSIFGTNQFVLTCDFTDVSTAETIYLVVPFASTLTKVDTVLQGAISGADSTITVRNHAGLSAGTLTISQAGSAAGDIDSLTPASNNSFAAGTLVSLTTDGASTTVDRLFVTLTFTRTA